MIAVDRNPWLVVLGSAMALTVGNGPIMQFTFGVFLKPVVEEFNVARGMGSLALTIGLITTACSLPLAGRLADRMGPRRLGLFAVWALAISLVSVALFSRSITTFIAGFALAGLAASGHTPLPYTKAVISVFDRRRGLALALALVGVGIGSIALPLIAQRLVAEWGWRGGYLGIAALLVLIATPALLLFIPQQAGRHTAVGAAPVLVGLTPREAVGSRSFWLMLFGLFLGAGATNGTIAHVIPMLTDRGMAATDATAIFSLVGLAAIAGRILGGLLLDRLWAPLVALVFLAGLVLGITMLLGDSTSDSARVAALLLGLGLGVEADLTGFLLTRYLGVKHYGALFGWVFGAFLLASSLGPLVMGWLFDVTGSYDYCLRLFIGAIALAAVAFLAMGAYRYPAVPPLASESP